MNAIEGTCWNGSLYVVKHNTYKGNWLLTNTYNDIHIDLTPFTSRSHSLNWNDDYPIVSKNTLCKYLS